MKEVVKDFYDFSGGYCETLADEKLADNEMLEAYNCYWDDGLKKSGHGGILSSLTYPCRGVVELFFEDDWSIIGAFDLGSTGGATCNAEFAYSQNASSWTTILTAAGSSYQWYGQASTVFAKMDTNVVIANGNNIPALIYNEGSNLFIRSLESYDERQRSDDTYYAGYWASDTYTDDTTDYQDTGASQDATYCPAAATSGNAGFWCACDFTYSKISFNSFNAASVTVTNFTLEYYNGATWTSVTTENEPDWNASSTNDYLEWEIPISNGAVLWGKWDIDTGYTDDFYGRYIVRGTIETAGATTGDGAFSYSSVTHTHYLSQIMGNELVTHAYTHKNTMFLAAGNQIQIGIANKLTDWRSDRFEYFPDGGPQIESLITYNDMLIVCKEFGLYAIRGNSWANWSVTEEHIGMGCVGSHAPVVWDRYLVIPGRKHVYLYDGNTLVNITPHIREFNGYKTNGFMSDTYLTGGPVSAVWKNGVLISDSFAPRLHYIDLTKLRLVGDEYRASVFRYQQATAVNIIYKSATVGTDNTSLLICATNSLYGSTTGKGFAYIGEDVGTVFPFWPTTGMQVKTKRYIIGAVGEHKHYTRAIARFKRIENSPSITTSTIAFDFTLVSKNNNGVGEATNTVTINPLVATTSSVVTDAGTTISVPYNIDGQGIAFYFYDASPVQTVFYGVSLESRKKRRL